MARRQKRDHEATVFHGLHGSITRLNAKLAPHVALDHHLIPVSHGRHAQEYAERWNYMSTIPSAYSLDALHQTRRTPSWDPALTARLRMADQRQPHALKYY